MTEAEILYRDKNTTKEEYKKFASNVIDDVKNLDNLVVSLLNTAKYDETSFPLNIEKLNLVLVTNEIALKFKETSLKRNIQIKVHSNESEIIVNTDKVLLQRLISIFIDNAIKYNKDNGTIDIKMTEDKLIEIKDSGVGIAKDNLPKIFDRFYRVSEDRNEKSHGLGLSIAKEIADLLKIKIKVKSIINKGTTFQLKFS